MSEEHHLHLWRILLLATRAKQHYPHHPVDLSFASRTSTPQPDPFFNENPENDPSENDLWFCTALISVLNRQ
jgi:hypothetical protein